MAESSIREWEYILDSIVDLTKLHTKAQFTKQLQNVQTVLTNNPGRGSKATVSGIEDYLEKKK